MGDTLDKAPPREPRRDKPQSLSGIEATKSLNLATANTTTTTQSEAVTPHTELTSHSARNRARSHTVSAGGGSVSATAAETRDERKHSHDGVVSIGGGTGVGGGAAAGVDGDSDGVPRRESLNCDDTSPSSHSFGKSLFGRTARHTSSGGATTRKCVLTLDGYSYVIVASTPDNLPKRERDDLPTGTGGINCGGPSVGSGSGVGVSAGSATASSSGSAVPERRGTGVVASTERSKSNSPTGSGGVSGSGTASNAGSGVSALVAEDTSGIGLGGVIESVTINGQIARHGSLTIVRRSNSRKSFTQPDTQEPPPLASPSTSTAGGTVTAATTATIGNSWPHCVRFTASNAAPVSATQPSDSAATAKRHNSHTAEQSRSGEARPTSPRNFLSRHTKSTPADTPQPVAIIQSDRSPATSNHATTSRSMQPSSPNEQTSPDSPTQPTVDVPSVSPRHSTRDRGSQSSVGIRVGPCGLASAPMPVDLATENLPAVDTPDACDKAAVRLRCLLHLLNSGEISVDVLQRNLHYAARVLEAVYIDESNHRSNYSKFSISSEDGSVHQTEAQRTEAELGGDDSKEQQQQHRERCNGNCKNVNCSQHSHENHTSVSGSPSNQDNNNSNSSCTLLRTDDNQQRHEPPHNLVCASHNLTSIDSRTKGVTLVPRTHSGPTGPPDAATDADASSAPTSDTRLPDAIAEEDETAADATTATTTITRVETEIRTATAVSGSGEGGPGQSVGSSSSSSSSNKATMQRQRRLRTPVWARSMSSNKTCHVKENHGQSIFGVAFNHLLDKDQPLVFATAGSNRCTIYECPRKGDLKLLMCYADPDPDEVFYTCAWSYDPKTLLPLLATAGYRGVIRVIDTQKNEAVGNYIGHGQAINELKYHPRQPHLLLSGSKDHAIRLWNTSSHVCIAIFGGVEGHRDEVLSVDFDLRGERFMSSGMDHSLKLWRINTPEFKDAIELSCSFNPNKSQLPFPTIMQHFPDFSTRDIHRNYVDCVQWFGDFVLSKSCENSIICWKPGQLHQSIAQLKPNDSSCTLIAEFDYDECEIWFVRFGFNAWQKVIALGNQHGKVYVWELDPSDPGHTYTSTLNNAKCTSTVRQVAFSRDASVLVYVCDDGSVWRWNKVIAMQTP